MLAEGLGILQGLQQLQTWQVGRQATGFGAKTKWSLARPGTAVFVNAATGIALAAVKDAVTAQQIGSEATPFASLEEALTALAAPATAEAFETPRTIYIGPGEYTVGAAIIRRSLNFVMDPAAVITDTVMCESSNVSTHSSTASVLLQFICPEGMAGRGARPECLPAGIQLDKDGVATRIFAIVLVGIEGVEINVGTGITGGLYLNHAGAELHAPGITFPLVGDDCTIEGTTVEASLIYLQGAYFIPTTVTCVGTNECRLYSVQFDADGAWTGGTLLIDPATNYDWATVFSWTKANPGGVAATVMV